MVLLMFVPPNPLLVSLAKCVISGTAYPDVEVQVSICDRSRERQKEAHRRTRRENRLDVETNGWYSCDHFTNLGEYNA